MLLHLLNRRLSPAVEERGYLLVAGTAHIAVLQLMIAQKADFLTAEIAELLLK
jgi:hypothetical protein